MLAQAGKMAVHVKATHTHTHTQTHTDTYTDTVFFFGLQQSFPWGNFFRCVDVHRFLMIFDPGAGVQL